MFHRQLWFRSINSWGIDPRHSRHSQLPSFWTPPGPFGGEGSPRRMIHLQNQACFFGKPRWLVEDLMIFRLLSCRWRRFSRFVLIYFKNCTRHFSEDFNYVVLISKICNHFCAFNLQGVSHSNIYRAVVPTLVQRGTRSLHGKSLRHGRRVDGWYVDDERQWSIDSSLANNIVLISVYDRIRIWFVTSILPTSAAGRMYNSVSKHVVFCSAKQRSLAFLAVLMVKVFRESTSPDFTSLKVVRWTLCVWCIWK